MDKLKINFELRFVILIIGVVVTSIAAWYFTRSSPSFEKVISILQVGLTFFALVYTAASISESSRVNENSSSLRKKEKTLEFLDRFHELDERGLTRSSRKARDAIRGKGADEITSTLDSMPAEKAALFTTINFFENLAIALNHSVADEEVAFSAFRSIVLGHRSTMLPFINKYRLDNNSNSYLKNFTDLAERWANR